MVELYKEKKFSDEDAKKIVALMSRHKDFFLDHMMVEVRLSSAHWWSPFAFDSPTLMV